MCRPGPQPLVRNVEYGCQLWYLLDPAGKKVQRINPSGVGLDKKRVNLPACYAPEHQPPLDTWTKLIRYDNNACPLGNVDDALSSLDCRTLPQKSNLLRLPLEIMWTIFDMLDAIDIVALASTCQSMFRICCTIIAQEIRMSSGDLAGYPLAIMGSDATSLPESFLKNDLAYHSIPPRTEINPRYGWNFYTGVPIGYSLKARDYVATACRQYQPSSSQSAATNTWLSVLDMHRTATAGTSRSSKRRSTTKSSKRPDPTPTHEPAHTLLTNLLHRTHNNPCVFDKEPTTSGGTQYYLRDHTACTLIRICTCPTPHIASHSEASNPKDPLTLDDVFTIMTRQSISSTFSNLADTMYTLDSGPWVTGPWAGHTFDIVSAARHTQEFSNHSPSDGSTPSAIWRDLTAAALVRAYWEYDRLHLSKWIASIGRPERGTAKLKWTARSRKEAGANWLRYIDSLYNEMMRPLNGYGEGANTGEELLGMVEMWREKFEEIVTKAISAQFPQKKIGRVQSGLSGFQWRVIETKGDKESGTKRKVEEKGKERGKKRELAAPTRQSKRLKLESTDMAIL